MSSTAHFPETACSTDAVQRASYRLCNRIAVEIRVVGAEIRCELWSLDGGDPDPADVADFRVEVNDQVLRERIREETAAVRNTVLALAFSQADLTEGG